MKILDIYDHISTLPQVRTCVEMIFYEVRGSSCKDALFKKSFQKQLVKLCCLMSSCAYVPILRICIESKDPWLWLAGGCFIGIDSSIHEGYFCSILNNSLPPDDYFDHANFLGGLEDLIRSSEFQRIYKNYVRQEQ